MNIGFDLDKIFVNYPPFIPSLIIDFLYRKRSAQELAYRIPSRPEQIIRQLSHHYIFRPPITENIESVKKIVSSKKNTYYLISSRFAFLERQTDIIIKKYDLRKLFKGLYFNSRNEQPHLFKNDMIKKLKIDLYVDDDLPLLTYLSIQNPQCKFYWLNNAKNGKIKNNITAITNLSTLKI